MSLIVLGDSKDRAAWLDARSKVLTASDVASLLGFGSKSRAQLFREKVARKEEGGDEIGGMVQVQAGRFLEEGIVRWWAEDHWDFETQSSTQLLARSDVPWLAATPDALVTTAALDQQYPLEVKCCGFETRVNWAENTWSTKGWPVHLPFPVPVHATGKFPLVNMRVAEADRGTLKGQFRQQLGDIFRDVCTQLGAPVVPIKYAVQNFVQQYVLGVTRGYVTCLMGGTSRLDFTLELTPEFTEYMLDETQRFWQLVEEQRGRDLQSNPIGI